MALQTYKVRLYLLRTVCCCSMENADLPAARYCSTAHLDLLQIQDMQDSPIRSARHVVS